MMMKTSVMAETFVAQLVDDEPLQRSGIEDWTREAPVVAGDDFVAAKPYTNPIFSWPDSRREAGAQGGAHDINHQGSITVPADPSHGPVRLFDADLFSGEYEDEQYSFLRKQELARFVGHGHVVKPGKPGLVTAEQRASLVEWVSEAHAAAPAASGNVQPLSVESFALAVNVLNRFLSTGEGEKVAIAGWTSLKIASMACLSLASKYEETRPPTLWGLAVVTSGDDRIMGDFSRHKREHYIGYDRVQAARKEIVAMERRVSSALDCRLTVPTVFSFLGVFMHRARMLGNFGEHEEEVVRREAERILLGVLRDVCSLSHLPSTLAAAALYWASCTAPGAVALSSFIFHMITDQHVAGICSCLRDVEIASRAGDKGMPRGRVDESQPLVLHSCGGDALGNLANPCSSFIVDFRFSI